MEKWEALVQGYPSAQNLRDFSKAVKTLEVLAREDLAQFELDWLLQTLFSKPIHLVTTVQSRYSEDGWSAVIGQCFVTLEAMGDRVLGYHEDIVTLCHLPYPAATRKRALQLLTAILKYNVEDVGPTCSHAIGLLKCADVAATVRAEAASLIGTICAHHPEKMVNDQEKEIWRLYLSVLEVGKTTNSIINGILLGINGLFKHFGVHLPTSELGCFYENLSSKYIYIDSCKESCLLILSNHANLFREKLATDVRLRSQLWTFVGGPNAVDALGSVYKNAVSDTNVRTVAATEIYPNTKSKTMQVKNVAYSILSALLTSHRRRLEDIGKLFDEQVSNLCSSLDVGLTGKLRTVVAVDTPLWEYDGDIVNLVTQAAWCIRSNIPNCDSLMSSLILLHDKLPTAKRKKLLIHTILCAEKELRCRAITFLIVETCRLDENQTSNLDKYLPLWQNIFDSEKGKDETVLEHSKPVFDEFVNYVLFALEEYLDNETELESLNLSTLLKLSAQIIQFENAKDYTVKYMDVLLNLLLDIGVLNDGLVLFVMNLMRIADDNCMLEDGSLDEIIVERAKCFYKQLSPNSCNTESLLCAVCLSVTFAPEVMGDCGAIYALQIIFSRNDVDSGTLSRALLKLEKIIDNRDLEIDEIILSDIISKLQRKRLSNDTSDKDARILHRDLTIFLGKYSHKSVVNNTSEETMLIAELKDVLVFTGLDKNLKLNLASILQLALFHEEPKSLESFLMILCTNLSNKKEPLFQRALVAVIQKLSNCHVRRETGNIDSLTTAVGLCDSHENVRCLVKYITQEKSPGARKILCNLLETLLLREPESETTENLLRVVVEECSLMMCSQNSITKMGGLDLVDTIISSIKHNNTLTKECLPELLLKILLTNVKYAESYYEMTSQFLDEKLVLFPNEILEDLKENLFIAIVKSVDIDLRSIIIQTLKTIKTISSDSAQFVNMVLNSKDLRNDHFKYLVTLSEANRIFAFEVELKRKIVTFDSCKVYAILKDCVKMADTKWLDVFYLVMSEYADVLLEVKYMLTIEYLSIAITNSQPQMLKKLHKSMRKCMESFNKIWRNIPQAIVNAFVNWSQKLPYKEFTRQLEQNTFPPEHFLHISALRKMLQMFCAKDVYLVLSDLTEYVNKWPRIVLQIYGWNSGVEFLKTKMAYVTEVLAVTFYFLKRDEVKGILLECHNLQGVSNEKIGIKFCRTFIKSFAPYLLENDVLLDDDMKCCCMLVHDLIKYYGRLECSAEIGDRIMELLDKLWPTLTQNHSTNELNNILKDLAFIDSKSLTLSSKPAQWLLGNIPEMETEVAVKKCVSVLPVFLKNGGDALNTNTSLSLHKTVLEMVASLADNPAPGCDVTLEYCASQLARTHTLTDIYAHSEVSMCVFNKLLVPAVRQASTMACEEFFSETMGTILSSLWRRGRTTHKTFLVQYTKAFTLAQLAFEKLPLSTLDSPSSPLYSQINLKTSRKISQEICKLCVTLRMEILPPAGGADDLKMCYRQFQQANLNCLSAVLCKTRPNENLFSHLFHKDVWKKIIDCDETWIVYIKPFGLTQTVPISVSQSASEGLTMFTKQPTFYNSRLLSDNPRAYSMRDEMQKTEAPPTLQLSQNTINSHPCATMCAALALNSNSTRLREWLGPGLRGERNVAWFLAQMIINCKADLKNNHSSLLPELLHVTATTACDIDGKTILNGLHVDILNTIAFWLQDTETVPNMTDEEKSNLNTTIELIIHTIVHHKLRMYVYKTLFKTLNDVLKLFRYFVEVNWMIFENYLKDAANEQSCLDILLSINKNKIYIPQLIPCILAKFESRQILANKLSKMAELLGTALACANVDNDANLSKLWKILDKLRISNCQDYVKVLFYAQNGFKDCCNEINFRHTADLAPKMIREQKTKCFEIISTYIAAASPSRYITDMFDNIDICEVLIGDHTIMALKIAQNGVRLMEDSLRRRVVFLASDYCRHSVDKIRRMAYQVMLKAFEGIFYHEDSEPLPKRPKTENASKILKLFQKEDVYVSTVIGRLAEGVIDKNKDISDCVQKGLHPFLAQDISVRYFETLLLYTAIPTPGPKGFEPATLTSLMRLVLYGHRDHLQKVLLSDVPIFGVSSNAPSKLLTMSRSYQGTFRSQILTKTDKRRISKETVSALNVRVPMDEILESFLQFSESTTQTSTALFSTITQAIHKLTTLTQSDIATYLSHRLAESVEKGRTVELSRCFVDQCCSFEGFAEAVEKLKISAKGSEAYDVINLLHEEAKLCTFGNAVCVLGQSTVTASAEPMCDDGLEFSLKDLILAFEKLSDWDDLSLQQKKRLRSYNYQLWTDDVNFRIQLEAYDFNNGPDWLHKMKLSLDAETAKDHYIWLKSLDAWPQRHFDVSAITEVIQWHNAVSDSIQQLPLSIKSADCLAKWSARMMVRSLRHTTDCDSPQTHRHTRSQELLYSEEANRRGLPELVLQCVRRNVQDLHESETLPWLHQQVQALRTKGLCGNTDLLERALSKTEQYTMEFGGHSNPDIVLSMTKMKLLLNKDLGILSNEKAESILNEIDAQKNDILNDKIYSRKCQKTMLTVYEQIMMYYDGSWDDLGDDTSKGALISSMTSCLSKCQELNCASTTELFLAVIVHRLAELSSLDEPIVIQLLGQIENLTDEMDDFLITELSKLKHLFPAKILQEHTKINAKLTEKSHTDKFSLCLQLICDPGYSLLQYVRDLADSIRKHDKTSFDTAFENMSYLFENPYAGPAYQLLNKYKMELCEIRQFETTEEYRKKASTIITKTLTQLSRLEQKSTLNLSELCPALTKPVYDESERDRHSLNRLLRLAKGVEVVRFEKQISVYPSLRRPCSLSVQLSAQTRVRTLLVKRGEPLRVEAAGRAAVRAFGGRVVGGREIGGRKWGGWEYHVTALSADCGVIEQLVDHTTLRKMISQKINIDQVTSTIRRPKDEELILASPTANLSQYNELCSTVPLRSLRSSIEYASSSVQEFVMKKRRFTDSLAVMSINDWVFGLADRHLDNIMLSQRDGSVCSVDWSAILEHGGLNIVPEMPPARLTRLLVAVCDVQVLESRLQSILTSLRESARLIMPYLHVLFKWMPEYTSEEFQRKLKLTEGILKGEFLSQQVTSEILVNSTKILHPENYMELLHEMFGDYPTESVYDVDQQITCFLRQCTDPKILSVTRRGWEPWL